MQQVHDKQLFICECLPHLLVAVLLHCGLFVILLLVRSVLLVLLGQQRGRGELRRYPLSNQLGDRTRLPVGAHRTISETGKRLASKTNVLYLQTI